MSDVRSKHTRIACNYFIAWLVFVFRLPLRTAEHPTDQLTPPFPAVPRPFPMIHHLSPPERPMKIEVVVDPSRLASTPSLASRVAPAENTAVVANGTQPTRSVVVALQVYAG
jgi:hypothetical protein